MTIIIGQQLCLLLIELWQFILSIEMTSLRILGSEAKLGHLWSTSFHDEESDGWCNLPSNSLSWACHMRPFAIFGDRNNLLNLGIGGKYHITFAGTPFLFLVFVLSNFHREVAQVGHEDNPSNHSYTICNHSNKHVFSQISFTMHSMSFLLHT